MVVIEPPLSAFYDFAQFCFLLAGLFVDVLLIRICLFSAYIFLLAFATQTHFATRKLQLEPVIWPVVNLLMHLIWILRLLWDARHVGFKPVKEVNVRSLDADAEGDSDRQVEVDDDAALNDGVDEVDEKDGVSLPLRPRRRKGTENEEAMWRCFYRRSGMERQEFVRVVAG